ncbi:hypothetical protein [Candidatus Burkholderia verschuerenii]|nr:hypothetical protein [Candidatus Burkholderia verschuerenii]
MNGSFPIPSATDAPALRDAARALERLDARLVALCVEQVLHEAAQR